jgi:hypothetical protein
MISAWHPCLGIYPVPNPKLKVNIASALKLIPFVKTRFTFSSPAHQTLPSIHTLSPSLLPILQPQLIHLLRATIFTHTHLLSILTLDMSIRLGFHFLRMESAFVFLLLFLFRGCGRWRVGSRLDFLPGRRGLEFGLDGLEERD